MNTSPRLSEYLGNTLPGFGSIISLTKFETGQSNPTYKLTTDRTTYVLRRKPEGELLKSAHAIDREFRVQQALENSRVPVAHMVHYCADAAIIGTEFYIMDHVEGRIFDDPRLTDLLTSSRRPVMDEMCRVLADLHGVDLRTARLEDYGPSGNYFERQLSRWTRQYRASETGPVPEMDALIDALGEMQPEDDGQRTLVHGDYRLDNLIFAADGPECKAVLDWELSTIGHPFADLAAVIMQWRMPPGADGRGLDGVDRAREGLPTDVEFIANYCAHRGIGDIADWGFYLAFSFFRMAAIIQGVKKRALDGNGSNPEKGLRLGKHVPIFAANGLKALANG